MFLAAYADESYDLPLGVYILTASLVDLTEAEAIRDALHALQSGPGKLHWYDADAVRRLHLAKTVGTLTARHISVVARSASLQAERGRRKCLEALLPELESAGAEQVLLETRQRRNNKHDIDMVDACRRKKLIGERLHVSFGPPKNEPLLWLPDIACGAALAAERGDDDYLQQFGDSSTVLSVKA